MRRAVFGTCAFILASQTQSLTITGPMQESASVLEQPIDLPQTDMQTEKTKKDNSTCKACDSDPVNKKNYPHLERIAEDMKANEKWAPVKMFEDFGQSCIDGLQKICSGAVNKMMEKPHSEKKEKKKQKK